MVSRENPGGLSSNTCVMFTYVEPVVFRAKVMSAPRYFVTAPPLLDCRPENRDGRGCYLLVSLTGPLEEMLRRDESSTELLEPRIADVCLRFRTLGSDRRSQPASG